MLGWSSFWRRRWASWSFQVISEKNLGEKKSFFQRLDKPSLDHLKHSNNGCFVIISVMVLSPCKLSTLTNASTSLLSLKTHLTTGEYITHTSIHQVSLPLLCRRTCTLQLLQSSYVFFLQRQQQKNVLCTLKDAHS